MEIVGYQFTGPFTDVTKVPLDARGVYVVVCLVDGEPHCCLDVGATRQLGNRLKSHDRESCWEENVHGEVGYCYKITGGVWHRELATNPLQGVSDRSESERSGIESELQWKLDVACGENPWREIEKYWEVYGEYEEAFGSRGSFEFE